MIGSLVEAVSRIPARAWAGLGIGGITVVFGVAVLYSELRAIVTDHHSIAYSEWEPDAVTTARRGMAWFFIVFAILAGGLFLWLGLASAYECAVVRPPDATC